MGLRECGSRVPTHLVGIEGFDLGRNGIKIPTDIVREEAGCEDSQRG